jgi:hypothetical protein
VSKERSSRRAPIKRIVTQTRATVRSEEQSAAAGITCNGREEYRELARAEVFAAWPQILQGLIEKARSGAYQHTKLLLDLCELPTEEPGNDHSYPGERLCDALLDNLRLLPPE